MRRLPLLLAVLLILAACTDTSGTTTTESVGVPSTSEDGSATTVASAPAGTTTTIDPELAETLAQVEALIPVTEDLRGLQFLEPPSIVVVTDEELEQRVRDLYEEELEPDEIARDQAVYRLLGIIDEDVDLAELLVDVYGGSVGGYYDLDDKELVVKASPDGLTVNERVIVVHELNHALTDQHFASGDVSQTLIDEERYDEFSAYSAIVEGDSTRVESEYIQLLSSDEIGELIAEYDDLDSSAFDSAPHFIQEFLVAPYLDGFEFLVDLDGTNATADAAYDAPPVSTEQVIDPDKYREGDDPVDVIIEGAVPEGYENGEESTWGATALRALLGASVDPGRLADAVDGWGGDRYRILFDGTNAALELHWVGDEASDLPEFVDAFERYLGDAVDGDDAWHVVTDGETVVVLVADEPALADEILAGLADFGPWEQSAGS